MTYSKLLALGAAIAITGGGLILMAPPAFGKPAPVVVTAPATGDVVTRHIGYADLNLAAPAGERTLTQRVGRAIETLCDEATGGTNGSVDFKRAMSRCGNSAWDQARPQIGLAVQRARDIASTGTSSIAAVAIRIALPE